MLTKLKEVSAGFEDEVIEFAQELIQTPSISGEEKEVADLLLAKMKDLGYDEVFRDEMGNVVGVVEGAKEGPTIMYNSHMDHVSPGDPDNWEGYDPYGGEKDVCEVDDQNREEMPKDDGTSLV